MRIQTNRESRHWRAQGLEGIRATGHVARSFGGRKPGDEVVREHKSSELPGFDVGGGDDSEHPGIEVQNPSQRVWGLGAHLCAPQIRPSVNCV